MMVIHYAVPSDPTMEAGWPIHFHSPLHHLSEAHSAATLSEAIWVLVMLPSENTESEISVGDSILALYR